MLVRPIAYLCALFTCFFTVAACEVQDSAHAPRVWTLIDVDEAFTANAAVITGDTFVRGLPATTFLEANPEGTTRPRVRPAFAEGTASAYVVAEMWTRYSEVWIQPWYSFITAWDEKAPSANRLKDKDGKPAPALYDVDVHSAFYSPFWRVIWVVVPNDTAVDKYKSSAELFDAKLRMYPGAPWIYSIRPDHVTVGDAKALHPMLGNDVGNFALGPPAWVEGQQKPSLNLGGNNFAYNSADVISEVAMFWFVKRGAAPETGTDLPAVIGTGPLGVRAPVEVVGNKPRFGGLCRLHLVALPPTAAAFDPDALPTATANLVTAKLDPAAYRGRVALNAVKVAMTDAACFEDPMFPATCLWLDSQAAVENRIGIANITRTEVSLTCPFVTYAGKAVK